MKRFNRLYVFSAELVTALLLVGCSLATPGVEVEPTGVVEPSETEESGSVVEPVETVQPSETWLTASLEVLDVSPDGEAVRLGFTLTNKMDSNLYVLQWYTPLEGIYGEIFQVKRDGQTIPYQGILASRAAPIPENYVLLTPGGSAYSEVDLALTYDFSQAGTYTIEFKSPWISHLARTKAEIAKTVEQLHPVQMPSTPVTVSIGDSNNEVTPQMLPTATPRPVLSREAVDLIQSYLRMDEAVSVEELTTDEIWNNLQVQVFRIIEDPYVNEVFLVRNKILLPVGTAFGGQGLTSLEISDLDRDGESELLFTYGFGSGIHQSRIGMYAPAYDQYTVLDAEFGYLGDIGIFKQSLDEIGVRVVEVNPSDLTILYLDTLGYLTIDDINGQPKLLLDLLPDLPVEIKQNLFSPKSSESHAPDSRSVGLVYTMDTGEGLWIVDREGQHTMLTEQSHARLSPDYQKLLYSFEDDIYIEDLANSEKRNLTGTPEKTERGYQWWPANPGVFVFNYKHLGEEGPSEGYLGAISATNTDYQVLDDSATSYTSPALSPDGNSIAYNPGGVPTLYHLDGGIETIQIDKYDLDIRIAASPAWSPDGRYLAWKIFSDETDVGTWSAVAVLDLVEGKARLLHKYRVLGGTNVMPGLSWSPDGCWLAVLTQGEFPLKTPSLWVLSADGQEEIYLGSGISQVWSPDGRWLAYASWLVGGGHSEDLEVFILDLENREPQLAGLPAGAVVVDWVSQDP